jgi:type II secretory pathway component PulF
MSRDPGELGSRPPRRDRQAPEPAKRPPPLPPDDDPGPSTFRPNPAGASAPVPGKPRKPKPKSAAARDPLDERPRITAEGPTWWERIFFGSVSSGQLAQFSRQFAAYLHAGVDIIRSLDSLEKQFSGTALGPVIGRIQLAIKRGASLEDAMAKEPQTFGRQYLSMIRVAEARGGVPETLKMLAKHLEARQRLIRQARSAMIYPIIVLVVAGGVVALITVVLLPMFVSFLKDLGHTAQLPLPSRMLIAFSQFVQTIGWWLIPVIVVATPFVLLRLYKSGKGKSVMDRMVLMTPVFGLLCRKVDTTRFARTLSVLLDAGLDFGTSIELTADVLMMDPIRNAVRSSKEKILAGKDLSVTLDASRQFSPDVIAVIASGEETGKLPESLEHLAEDYEEQVAIMVKNLGQLVQPLLIVFLGGIVLFIILAVFMPYIQMILTAAGGGG